MTSSADVNRDIPASIPKLDSPDISYDIASYAHSLPRMIRFLRDDGKFDNIEIGAVPEEMKFKIPAGTYNLSKSVLSYSWEAKGNMAAQQMWARADLLPILRVRLATQEGGSVLTELMYADHYTRIVNKAETPLVKFLTNDDRDALYPCNTLVADNKTGFGQLTGSVNYLEPKYYRVAAAGVAPLVAETKNVELSIFKNTLLELDKMIYYPEPLELTIWFQGRNSWYFEAKSADAADSPLDASQDIKMNGLSLFVRQESDPTIDAECKDAVLNASIDAPFTLYTPVVTSRKMPTVQGFGSSMQIQLGTQMGTRLTKVYAIPQSLPESKGLQYDSSNFGALKVSGYQTKFNSLNVQPNIVNVRRDEDYMQIKDIIKGTAIMNRDVHLQNWFILDDYSGITEETKSIYPPGKHNLVTGKKLQLGDTFELVADTGANLQWYIFFVGQRVLRIAPFGKGGIGYL